MYIKGDYWMICDRCGFAYRKSQMKETWDGLWVCEEDWEPKHPQLSVKAKHDDQRVPVVRNDKSSEIGTTTTSVAASEGSKILTLTNPSTIDNGDSIGITLDNGEVQWLYVDELKFPGGYNNSIYGDHGDIETNAQSAFSVSMYFTANNGYVSQAAALCGAKVDTDYFVVMQNSDIDGGISVIYISDGDSARFDTGSILVNGPNPKKHIIVSVSDDYIRVYIDNEIQVASGSNDGDTSGLTMEDFEMANNLYIGAINYTSNGDLYHFDGKIDKFQFHTSAISTLSTYSYSSVIGLSDRLNDSVASGNNVYLSSSVGVNSLSSAVSVDDL